jgi:hypothetical protein
MSLTLQWLIVLPLVLGAAMFAGWRLLTPRLRLKVLAALLRLLPQTAGGVTARWRASIARRIAAETAGGCAACSRH